MSREDANVIPAKMQILKITLCALTMAFSNFALSYHFCVQWKQHCAWVRSCNSWKNGNFCYMCEKTIYDVGAPHTLSEYSCSPQKTHFMQSEGYICRYVGHPSIPQTQCMNWSSKYICKMFCVKTI